MLCKLAIIIYGDGVHMLFVWQQHSVNDFESSFAFFPLGNFCTMQKAVVLSTKVRIASFLFFPMMVLISKSPKRCLRSTAGGLLYSDTILNGYRLGLLPLSMFHLVSGMQIEFSACGFIGSDDFVYGFVRNVRLSPELSTALFTDFSHILSIRKRILPFLVTVSFKLSAHDRFVFTDCMCNHFLRTTLLIHGRNCVPLFPG